MKQQIGLMLLVLGVTSCGGGSSTAVVGSSALTTAPSVSGDMVPLTTNATWTYQTVNAASAYTVTLHANNNNLAVSSALTAFVVPGLQSNAITSNPSATISQSLFLQPTSGSFNVLSVTRTRNGSFSIPGSPQLVPNTLTLGQTFSPYLGVTATVTFVGTVPGAGACPTPTTGATVAYAFQGESYTVSYVPNCGISDFVTNTGVEFSLISISQETGAAVAAAERSLSGTTLLDTIRDMTNAFFRR
jgi:hypothetical protein